MRETRPLKAYFLGSWQTPARCHLAGNVVLDRAWAESVVSILAPGCVTLNLHFLTSKTEITEVSTHIWGHCENENKVNSGKQFNSKYLASVPCILPLWASVVSSVKWCIPHEGKKHMPCDYSICTSRCSVQKGTNACFTELLRKLSQTREVSTYYSARHTVGTYLT